MSFWKLREIRGLVSDVDGVMTDGSIIVSGSDETKVFNVRDGLGIKLLQKAGIEFAILTGRESETVRKRAKELGIRVVKIGRLDKELAFEEIALELGLPFEALAYIGDDLPDLAPLMMSGFAFAPSDAVLEVQATVDHVLPTAGGKGAVRQAAEMILKAQDEWDDLVASFEASDD